MKNPPKQVVKYGSTVWSNVEMDELRKTECLCLNCTDLESCWIANLLHEHCEFYNLAFMMTRCKDFKQKVEV